MTLASVNACATSLGISLTLVPHLQNLPPAGRVCSCIMNWRNLSDDPWILETVQGYRLELAYTPKQQTVPKRKHLPESEQKMVSEEVEKLLLKQAVRQVKNAPNQFLSDIFLVPKKDGSLCPVINLKPLNHYIRRQKFKMEGAKVIKDILQKGDWMVSIDLKDAYLSVAVAEEYRQLLRFRWKGTLYEFQCLPFGLSSAPRVFTKLMKPVVSLLRRQGVRCIIFLDDLLVMQQTQSSLRRTTLDVLTLLQVLGFRINREKSGLTPTRLIQYLGLVVDSTQMTISLPEDKLKGIVQSCNLASKRSKITIRDLARLIGKMTATMMAVLPAPLCYRNLQHLKNQALLASPGNYEREVHLDLAAKEELQWWKHELLRWNGRPLHPPSPDLTIETDASLLGWGAATEGTSTGGLWSEEERQSHINHLELMGAELAVRTFTKDRAVSRVHLRMDNKTAVCYINHMGGTRSRTMSHTACQLWEWCLGKGLMLSAEYLPGKDNVTADRESRTLQSSAEWKLDRSVFLAVMELYGPCTVDLFASRLNFQLPHYISWHPDPYAVATDAFQIVWKSLQGYAFPPFSLIGRCLQKIRQEGSTVVMVAPVWPSQPWYPWLLEMLSECPALLPVHSGLLKDPFNRDHPLLMKEQLQLAAWKVSGIPVLCQGFRAELLILLQQDGERVQTQHTNQDGRSGQAGVIQGISIPFRAVSTIS